MSSDGPEQRWARATDHDRQAHLDGLWPADPMDKSISTDSGDDLPIEQAPDHRQRLVQLLHAVPSVSWEGDPEGVVLVREPSRAHPEDGSAHADVIEGGRQLCGQSRVAQGVRRHKPPNRHPSRERSQPGIVVQPSSVGNLGF